MSKNNQATQNQYNDIYDTIKKYDVNSLRAFLYNSTKDITDALDYWTRRKITLINPDEIAQRDLVNFEIIRLESILLARTQFTLDFFKVSELNSVVSDAETLGVNRKFFDKNFPTVSGGKDENKDLPFGPQTEKKRWGFKTLENLVKDAIASHKTKETIHSEIINLLIETIVDLGDNKTVEISTEAEANKYYNTNFVYLVEAAEKQEKEAKVIQMIPDTIKQNALAEKCKELILAGKKEEALNLAKGYLLNAKYIPVKEKQKPEKWHEARVKSWIDDLEKSAKKHNKTAKPDKEADTDPGKETNPTTDAKETAQPASSTTVASENASQEETSDEEPGTLIAVPTKYYDNLCKWLKSVKCDIKDIVPEDVYIQLQTKKGREEYSNIIFEVANENVDKTLENLKKFGVKDAEIKVEDELEESNESNAYINEESTLQKEVEHIDTLLAKCKELRGSDEGKAQNMDKIKEEVNLFFNSRPANEYKDSKEFINVIENRPKLITSAKDFFSHMCYEKMIVFEENNEKDQYQNVVDAIKNAPKDDKFETEFVINMVKKLKHKILLGTASDNKTPVNKAMFYTSYHVLHFIDVIVESSKGPESDQSKVPGEHVTSDVTGAGNVSTEQIDTASEKPIDPAITLAEEKKKRVDKLEGIILSVIKSNGILEDVLNHPTLLKMKGQEFDDPEETGTLVLTEDNYQKFISKKFEEINETYVATLKEYPVAKLLPLIIEARKAKVSAEDFAKTNLKLLEKKDKTFLPIKGTIDNVDSIIKVKNLEGFTAFIKEIYEIKDKLDINNKYEVSEIESYKHFENEIKVQVLENKLSLNDLKKWASDKVSDKLFPKEPEMLHPMFNSQHPEMLDSYLEAFTRAMYTSPESIVEMKKKAQEHIDSKIGDSTVGLLSFTNEVRIYCRDNKIDTGLKEIREMCVSSAKIKNKAMYDKYMENLKSVRGTPLSESLPKDSETKLAVSTKPVKTETSAKKEEVIVSPADTKDLTDIIKDALVTAKSEKDVKDVLVKYKAKENEISALKAVKSVVCDKKQISDMSMTEAEVNQWVKTVYTDKELANIKEAEVIGETRKEYENETFEELANAKDKHGFKESLKSIVKKFNDSSKLREAIVNAINSGKGLHTVRVAKQSPTEHHKMIKKAFENYNDSIGQTE